MPDANSWSYYVLDSMDHSIQYHDGENQREVAVRVPEEGTRPFLRLLAHQAHRHVHQYTTQHESAYQVEIAHSAHGKQDQRHRQQQQRIQQDLLARLTLAHYYGQHWNAGLLVV